MEPTLQHGIKIVNIIRPDLESPLNDQVLFFSYFRDTAIFEAPFEKRKLKNKLRMTESFE